MKELKAVFVTDALNRDRTRITVSALVGVLWDEHELGRPTFLSHDCLRPLGWSRPVALHFQPGLVRLFGLTEIPETEDERDRLGAALRFNFGPRMLREREQELAELHGLLAPFLDGSETAAKRECPAFVSENLARRVFPGLFAGEDKDGLVPLEGLTPIGPGVFRQGQFVFFAHPFFRRSLYRLNSLNQPFLAVFQDLQDTNTCRRIALDPDTVGLASKYQTHFEFEYWWGPHFSDELTSIPPGVTRHVADEIDRQMRGISATEFWWQSRDMQHILEVEELRDVPTAPSTRDTVERFGCRYVHSIVNEATSTIEHLDGAVRSYPADDMIHRLGVNLSQAGRHTEYTKLWRIDGSIPFAVWKKLISDYFRDNHLVGEYLGASHTDEDALVRSSTPDEKLGETDDVMREVPYSMERGMGVRIALSFREPTATHSVGREVVSLHVLEFEGRQKSFVEAEAVELQKIFGRLGESLHVPVEAAVLACEDLYANLPPILHQGNDVEAGVRTTLQAITQLVQAWDRTGQDRVLSYAIGFPVEDRECLVSVMGHVADLSAWLNSPLSIPPPSREELFDWAERVRDHLTATLPPSGDRPALFGTLASSGVLFIRRTPVRGVRDVRVDDHGLVVQVGPPENPLTLQAFSERRLAVAPQQFLRATRCSQCGEEYLTCPCSAVLDDGVAIRVEKFEPRGFFWTDRHACEELSPRFADK